MSKKLVAVLAGMACLAVPAGAAGDSPDRTYEEYVAPPPQCPDTGPATAEQRVETMLCLIDYARGKAEVAPVVHLPELARSSEIKADDIERCDDFSHQACGRSLDAPAEEAGYTKKGSSRPCG